jgi:hypothetical protein
METGQGTIYAADVGLNKFLCPAQNIRESVQMCLRSPTTSRVASPFLQSSPMRSKQLARLELKLLVKAKRETRGGLESARPLTRHCACCVHGRH